jgi:hypothetical protein
MLKIEVCDAHSDGTRWIGGFVGRWKLGAAFAACFLFNVDQQAKIARLFDPPSKRRF